MAESFPWYLLLVFECLHISLSYPTTRNYIRKWLIAPSMIVIAIYLWTQTPILTNTHVAYMIGFNLGFRLCFMFYPVYMQPEFPDFWRRVQDGDQPPSTFGSTSHKLRWMIDLAYGVRRVGWVQEPTESLPSRPKHESQLAFIASRTCYLMVWIFALVLTTTHQSSNPIFDPHVHPSVDDSQVYLRGQNLARRALGVATWGIALIGGLQVAHIPVAMISVGFGISSPADWPGMAGSFAQAYTVRKFWGKAWHQIMRPIVSSIGKNVAYEKFQFTPGTNLSAYTQLYIAFFISGLTHVGGDYMVRRYLTSSTMQFFMLQAIAITLEDFFIWLAKPLRAKLGWFSRAVGFCYVIAWFTWSGPLFLDPMSVDGYVDVFKPLVDVLRTVVVI